MTCRRPNYRRPQLKPEAFHPTSEYQQLAAKLRRSSDNLFRIQCQTTKLFTLFLVLISYKNHLVRSGKPTALYITATQKVTSLIQYLSIVPEIPSSHSHSILAACLLEI